MACQGPGDGLGTAAAADAAPTATTAGNDAATSRDDVDAAPPDAFFDRLRPLCGQAFAGRIVADTPPPGADDPFVGKSMVMHVRKCSTDEIRIPFHVGDDRSRTWVLTRTGSGLRLKHDHRHMDGSEDVLTMYGGDTVAPGSATRQEFPVDGPSQALFSQEGRSVSNTNVWAMEIEPGQTFAYELSRPERLFRVEFDLSQPVELPPAPWGVSSVTQQ
jgi:hypothetical protein